MDYPPARLLNLSNFSALRLVAVTLLIGVLGAAPVTRATPFPITLSASVQQTSFDPLDAANITLYVRNTSSAPVTVHFAQTGEYAISLSDATREVWAFPASPGQAHARTFYPGTTPLVTYEWNGALADGSAPATGNYTLLARLMLAPPYDSKSETVVHIGSSLPVAALLKTGEGIVTVSGTLDVLGGTLTDRTGSVKLTRRMLHVAPGTMIDVRGSMAKQPDGTEAFYVERWAPAAIAK